MDVVELVKDKVEVALRSAELNCEYILLVGSAGDVAI
jgi:hypothetical protein